jgi:alpha-L-fucosidase
MLGLAPDRRGMLSDEDVARLKEFGEATRQRYANNLALHHLPANDNVENVDFGKPVTFDRALTMEWLTDGPHVQKYSIDVWTGKTWKGVVGGQAIGHKKIDVFEPVTAERVRLNILSSSAEANSRVPVSG